MESTMNKERREFMKKTAYVAPAVMSLGTLAASTPLKADSSNLYTSTATGNEFYTTGDQVCNDDGTVCTEAPPGF